jgi:ribose-phosphate pyrophosphokinase
MSYVKEIKGVRVFTLHGCESLAVDICQELSKIIPVSLRDKEKITLSDYSWVKFSNENIQVQLKDSVRGYYAVIICSQTPALSDNILTLYALINALKNSGVAEIFLVFSYLPYSRSDRKNKERVSVMSDVFLGILNKYFGIQKILLLDPHASHLKHYCVPYAEEITAMYLIGDFLQAKIIDPNRLSDFLLTFPDASAKKRNERLVKELNLPFDYIDKIRPDDQQEIEIQKGICESSLKGKTCIMIDDEILSGGTARDDAENLKGAKETILITTHAPLITPLPSLSVLLKMLEEIEDKAKLLEVAKKIICTLANDPQVVPYQVEELVAKLEMSKIDRFIFTDSIPTISAKVKGHPKFTIISIAKLMAQAINRMLQNESITALLDPASVDLYRPNYD